MKGVRAAPAGKSDGRLLGWASIGGYIGRDARTAQRYEIERSLPVRRMPGAGRSTVFALCGDLDAWMHGLEASAAPPRRLAVANSDDAPSETGVADPDRLERALGLGSAPEAPRPAPARRGRVVSVILGGCAGCVLALGGLWLTDGGLAQGRAVQATPQALDQGGAAALTARSPAGLARAIDDYTQAIVHDPDDVAAYAGLADSYNLAPEVMGMAPADAYPRARAAAERALALDPRSVQALRAMAFVDFWWVQDRARAIGEFERALRLQPQSAQTLHWYANALAAGGDGRATALIDRALTLAPSPAMLVDKGWILLTLGRGAEARALLEDAVRTFPDNARAHEVLSSALQAGGDLAGALREARVAAGLRHDTEEIAVADAAQRALDTQGLPGMERAVAAARTRFVASGVTSPFLAATADSRVRQRQATLDMLERARQAHEPAMASLDINPDFAWLRNDAAFRTLAAARSDGRR